MATIRDVAMKREVTRPVPASSSASLASRRRWRGVDEDDAQLLQRISAGDLRPLGSLYDRHHASVRNFILRATARGADADDLTHETFLALASVAARYDGRPSARPLLLGIAALLVRQHRRGAARFLEVMTSFASGLSQRSTPTPEDTASTTENLHRFDQALARLPQEKRLVLLLVECEGLSGEAVAQALQVPLNTVWTRLHYARAELRRVLGNSACA